MMLDKAVKRVPMCIRYTVIAKGGQLWVHISFDGNVLLMFAGDCRALLEMKMRKLMATVCLD